MLVTETGLIGFQGISELIPNSIKYELWRSGEAGPRKESPGLEAMNSDDAGLFALESAVGERLAARESCRNQEVQS